MKKTILTPTTKKWIKDFIFFWVAAVLFLGVQVIGMYLVKDTPIGWQLDVELDCAFTFSFPYHSVYTMGLEFLYHCCSSILVHVPTCPDNFSYVTASDYGT